MALNWSFIENGIHVRKIRSSFVYDQNFMNLIFLLKNKTKPFSLTVTRAKKIQFIVNSILGYPAEQTFAQLCTDLLVQNSTILCKN